MGLAKEDWSTIMKEYRTRVESDLFIGATMNLKTIFYATDFGSSSRQAFQIASSLAHDYGARLVVFHAVMSPAAAVYRDLVVHGEFDGSFEGIRKELQKIKPPDRAIRVEHRLQEGEPATEILKLAKELNPDLIVMGTHGRPGAGKLMGSVAEKVVREAPCPVLTVKVPG
jgi:nucleotide-binding universal stress UspA family protein